MFLSFLLCFCLSLSLHADLTFETRYEVADLFHNVNRPALETQALGEWLGLQSRLFYTKDGLTLGLSMEFARLMVNIKSISNTNQVIISNVQVNPSLSAGWEAEHNEASATLSFLPDGRFWLSHARIAWHGEKQALVYTYRGFDKRGSLGFNLNGVGLNGIFGFFTQSHRLKHALVILPFLTLEQQFEADMVTSDVTSATNRFLPSGLLFRWRLTPKWRLPFGKDWNLISLCEADALLSAPGGLNLHGVSSTDYRSSDISLDLTNWGVGLSVQSANFGFGYERSQNTGALQMILRPQNYAGLGIGQLDISFNEVLHRIFFKGSFSPFDGLKLESEIDDWFAWTIGVKGNVSTSTFFSGNLTTDTLQLSDWVIHIFRFKLEAEWKWKEWAFLLRGWQWVPVLWSTKVSSSDNAGASHFQPSDSFDGGRAVEVGLRVCL